MKAKGMNNKGWHGESMRHSQAAKGIKSGRKPLNKPLKITDSFVEDDYRYIMVEDKGKNLMHEIQINIHRPKKRQIRTYKKNKEGGYFDPDYMV